MRDEHGVQRLATDRRTPRTRVSRVRCRVSGGPCARRCVLRAALAVPAMTMIEDRTMTALHSALTGLAERQRVTADNIAIINTPGFLAGRTDFESALKGQLADGETPTISGGTVSRSLEPTNTNGNNVNLDSETVIATETGLRYQLALNALDGKYSLLRSALKTT